MKRAIFWVGLSLLLIICNSLITNQQPIQFIKIRFHDLEPSLAWAELGEQQIEEQGVSLYPAGIYALNGNTLFVFGKILAGTYGRSVLLRSGDSGQTWHEVMTPLRGNSVLEVAFVENGLGWVIAGWTVEDMGPLSLYQSTDFGQTWKRLSTIYNDRGTLYGMMFSNELYGQIKIVYGTGSPYSDRLAILTTTDGGLTWVESDSFAMYDPWDGITPPTRTIDVTDRNEVRERFSEMAGWNNPEDGFECWEQCESIGQDETSWRLLNGGFQKDHAISRRSPADADWTRVTAIPRNYSYFEGRIIPLEK